MVAVALTRFDHLFERLSQPLHALAYRVVGNEAEEVVQEAFARLADDAVLRRPDDEVAAWLRRVCLNLAFNYRRDGRRRDDRWRRASHLADVAPDDDPAAAALLSERRAAVRLALGGLPERQRDCLLLRHSGYSYAEIAATLGIAIGSVGVILSRAEQAFRARYQEKE